MASIPDYTTMDQFQNSNAYKTAPPALQQKMLSDYFPNGKPAAGQPAYDLNAYKQKYGRLPYFEEVSGGPIPEQFSLTSKYENMLANQATAQGPTRQAQYLMEANRNQANANLGDMYNRNMGSANTGLSQLAMRSGGLNSGDAGRIVSNAQSGAQTGAQSLYANLANNNLSTLAQDEASKTNKLGNLLTLAEKRRAAQLSAWGAIEGGKEASNINSSDSDWYNPFTW